MQDLMFTLYVCAEEDGEQKEEASRREAAAASAETSVHTAAPSQPAAESATAQGSSAVCATHTSSLFILFCLHGLIINILCP